MKKKHFLITFLVSIALFSLVIFLIYVIYCFAFYDNNQEKKYLESFNNGKYDFVYDHLENADKINKDLYNYNVNITFNKNKLNEIYELYYKNVDHDEFICNYYFNNITDNVDYYSVGKTNLLKRKNLYYRSVEVINGKGVKTSFGVKKNLTLKVDEDSNLSVDDKECAIDKDTCTYQYIMGGNHTILYTVGQVTYYGILNVTSDNMNINVENVESLIKIGEVKEVQKPKKTSNIKLKSGKYKETKCYMAFDCANKKKSFLILNDDGTANLYLWFNLAQAGDSYFGTYEIVNNYLIMKFNGHTYKEFDYDTKVTTTIDIDVYSEFRYKIENDHTINNEEYRFVLSE